MAVSLWTFVFVTFSLTQQLATAGEIRFEVNPQKCIASLHDSVHISCSPGEVIDSTKDITLIEITRNNQDPIAFVRDCSNVTYGTGNPGQIQAVGHIDKDPGQSYLNLTMTKPKSEDTGVYTCVIYYVDQAGHVMEERTSGDLAVEKLDVESLELVLDGLKDKMAALETKVKDVKKESNVVAFSATRKEVFAPPKGSVVVFSDVLLRLGSGYDERTGVFTAPVKGLYVFNLVIRMENSNYRIAINLKANNEIVSRLYAGDRNYSDQSTIASLLRLDVGDQVKLEVEGVYGTGSIERHPYNSFSGYLLTTL